MSKVLAPQKRARVSKKRIIRHVRNEDSKTSKLSQGLLGWLQANLFSLSLVTVQQVFAKVNSTKFPSRFKSGELHFFTLFLPLKGLALRTGVPCQPEQQVYAYYESRQCERIHPQRLLLLVLGDLTHQENVSVQMDHRTTDQGQVVVSGDVRSLPGRLYTLTDSYSDQREACNLKN